MIHYYIYFTSCHRLSPWLATLSKLIEKYSSSLLFVFKLILLSPQEVFADLSDAKGFLSKSKVGDALRYLGFNPLNKEVKVILINREKPELRKLSS